MLKKSSYFRNTQNDEDISLRIQNIKIDNRVKDKQEVNTDNQNKVQTGTEIQTETQTYTQDDNKNTYHFANHLINFKNMINTNQETFNSVSVGENLNGSVSSRHLNNNYIDKKRNNNNNRLVSVEKEFLEEQGSIDKVNSSGQPGLSGNDRVIIKSKNSKPSVKKVTFGSYPKVDDEVSDNGGSGRLIDGEFNEEESHNSFMEVLNNWRRERNQQKEKEINSNSDHSENKNLNNNKTHFFDTSSYTVSKNVSETQTKEINNSTNIDEILKKIKISKSGLSYMEKLALHKYRQKYNENINSQASTPSLLSSELSSKNDKKTEEPLNEQEIEEEAEKIWEVNVNDKYKKDYEKEINEKISQYIKEYKQKETMNKNNLKIIQNEDNQKKIAETSILVVEDVPSESEYLDNEIDNEIEPIVSEPED